MDKKEFDIALNNMKPDAEELKWAQKIIDQIDNPEKDAPPTPFTYEFALQGIQEMRY